MNAGTGFTIFLLTTVGLLARVVLTGRSARRRQHIPAVVAMALSLALAIWFAERLGEEIDVRSAGIITPIHLTLAKITTLGYLLPIATGIRTLRHPATRRLHGRLAYTLVGLTLLTTVTGLAMLLSSDRVVP